jgi:hypothetical protein
VLVAAARGRDDAVTAFRNGEGDVSASSFALIDAGAASTTLIVPEPVSTSTLP